MSTYKVITDASVIKDGGTYKGRAGIVVLDDQDSLTIFESKKLGNVTSNEGEYHALLEGVKGLTDNLSKKDTPLNSINLKLFTDSSLVFNQMMKNFRTKKSGFVALQNEIKALCKKYKSTTISWHKREYDLAMLADFGSKYPRRTKSIFTKLKNQHVSESVTKAAKLLLKDENAKNTTGEEDTTDE